MDSDLNMVPNVDSGMQEDHVQATSAAAAAPEPHGQTAVPAYVGLARLYFGQIPADLVEEAGTVVASFQQLQLDDHGGESDSPASDDVGAQAAEVAAVLQQPDAPAEKKRKLSYRCGSPSKSSEFLGVTHYQRTGRWEAHIWVDDVEPHKQLYLGASATEEEAARAYDKAALVLRGEGFQDRINFKPAQQYEDDVKRLKLLTKDQMALFLRGDSKGTGAVWTYPYVRKIKPGIFEATYAENWKRRSPVEEILGSYSDEEEAARAVYDKAVQENNKDLAQSIKDISIVRTLPTTAQRAAIDAGLPVPSAQKTVTSRRRKQKARRKPYTPRKKKLDVVAGAAAATGGHDQTLQQDNVTMSEDGTNKTDTDQYVQLPAADDDDLNETPVTMSWEHQEVDVQDVKPTPDRVLFNPVPLILPSYVQADDPVQLPARPVIAAAGNNAAAPAADELPKNSAATEPYLPFDPLKLQILRPLN